MADNVATSLSLMRRLPPSKIEQNLSGLLNLLPDDQEELLQRIDQPLEVATDADVSVLCDCHQFARFLLYGPSF